MLTSGVIQWLKNSMPHRRSFKNFTNQAQAIWDFSNHDLFLAIPDPGSQKRITLSLESISTITFGAGNIYVKLPEWGQHRFNREMPCLSSIFGIFQGTWDQPNKNAGVHVICAVDISSNITNCEIKWPGMLIAPKIEQFSHVQCIYDWHNRCSSRKLIVLIPPPISCDHLTLYSAFFRVCEAQWFPFEVRLKWEMCKMELYTFEIVLLVKCSEDMWTNFNPTILAEPEMDYRGELSHGIRWLLWFEFEVVQSTPEMLSYQCFRLLAIWFSPLQVVW